MFLDAFYYKKIFEVNLRLLIYPSCMMKRIHQLLALQRVQEVALFCLVWHSSHGDGQYYIKNFLKLIWQ
jgi:hypothetical protein